MNKNRVIYNVLGLFAGPCPSSGNHFLTTEGVTTNVDDTDLAINLVFPIHRVNQASYGFSIPRTDLRSLGYAGNIARPSLQPPNVSLSFSYYQMGLINEARLGFVFNRPSGETSSSPPIYGTGRVIPISGFLDRSYSGSIETSIGWPLTTRDSRNIFIATREDGEDLNDRDSNTHYKSTGVNVYSFGDCFITNYTTTASVGAIPQASVQFTCNNIEYYNYSSGKNIPSVSPRDFSIISGKLFNLPTNFEGSISNTGLTSVVLPGDISLSITKNNGLEMINLPFDINDIKIQSYQIDMSLDREPLLNLGYKLPMDRLINLPAFVNLDIEAIVGGNQTGSLATYLSSESQSEYDIKIKLNYKPYKRFNGTAIEYLFLKSKLNNISITDIIGRNRLVSLSFTSEMNQNKLNDGFYISGQLGVYVTKSPLGGILLGDDFNFDDNTDQLLTEEDYGVLVSNPLDRILF